MKKIFVTRKIPDEGLELLEGKGYKVDVSEKDGVLSEEELISALKKDEYDAVLCLLTDKIGAGIFAAAPKAKIFANYAVGYNNIDVEEAKRRGVIITNTPGVLTDTVAEHTVALMLSITSRIAEGDRFVRAGKYAGWAPMLLLGTDLKGKTLAVLGAGRIGYRVSQIANKGLGMNIIYHDVKRNEKLEKEVDAVFMDSAEKAIKEADVITVHVPLLDSTRHLMNKERIALMKKTAYLINSSRGPVIDEKELYIALKSKAIAGAAIDVFENEPSLADGMSELDNVVVTPHIASATKETRGKMSEIAAENIISVLSGEKPKNPVY